METATKPAPVQAKPVPAVAAPTAPLDIAPDPRFASPAQPVAAVADPDRPRSRRYLFKVNDSAPKDGAWNGTCLCFPGDQFFLTLNPVKRKIRGPDGKYLMDKFGRPQTELVNRALPTWADVVDEYPIESAPKPLRARVAGSAPSAS